MITKKSKALLATAAILGLGTFGGLKITQAQSADVNPAATLVAAIAQRFNLNQSEVQQVFDDHRGTMGMRQRTHRQDRLSEAVKNGQLTQAQADQITAKQAEMRSSMQTLAGKTESERREVMQQHRDEMKTWAQANNIPVEFFGQAGPRGKF